MSRKDITVGAGIVVSDIAIVAVASIVVVVLMVRFLFTIRKD